MNNFRRVLLKLSGESLMGAKQYGIDNDRLADYAQDIEAAVKRGIQVAIVIGGGNIFRGLSGAAQGFDRVQGDQMGMLATVINSLALGSALTSRGVKNRVLTAIRMEPIGEFYSKRRAIDALEADEEGRIDVCCQDMGLLREVCGSTDDVVLAREDILDIKSFFLRLDRGLLYDDMVPDDDRVGRAEAS